MAWLNPITCSVSTASILMMMGAVLATPVPAIAPDDPAPAPRAAAAAEDAGDETPPRERPPSLDELLGIDGEVAPPAEGRAEDVAEQDAGEELQRRLNEEEIVHAFEVALTKMAVAADQLDKRFDTGLGTQRVQEEVLARLSDLLAEARKQCAGGSSATASARRQQSPQQQPPARQDEAGPNSRRRDEGAGEGQATEPPPPTGVGDMNAVLDESRSEWGNLPQRVREMLLQGRREKFSSLYEQLTREYYRRLAEEGSS